jgi:hypothetical protein
MRVVRSDALGAGLMVVRPDHAGPVVAVVGAGLEPARVRALGAMLLYRAERAQLAAALRRRTLPTVDPGR